MIRVTVWNENVQEQGVKSLPPELLEKMAGGDAQAKFIHDFLEKSAQEIKVVHPNGIHNTLKEILEEEEDITVRTVTLDMPECGLTQEVLDDTDVLVWWAHIAHERVPDEIVARVKDAVLRGMGFIPLHSAHQCKPLQALLGTSGSLGWREGDRSRVWCVNPTHPIAKGIPAYIDLPEEEMYSEFFDIPQPDEQVFISWYAGGEVFRSGNVWYRGYGRIFYFQPGHETNRSYFIPEVRQIIKNAVRWAAPTMRREKIDCPHLQVSAEAAYAAKQEK